MRKVLVLAALAFCFPARAANGSGKTLVRSQQGTIVPISGAPGLYVDGVNGNDANGGRSRGAALKTIAALIAKSPAAGSNVWVARGSYWREELSGLAAGVIVRAYGSGNRPVFDAADVAVNANFTKTGGRTNVYQITWTHELDAAGKVKHSAWENGVRLTRVADLATCDSTAGSFYAPSPDTTNKVDTIYVHPTGDTNPIGDGKTYEFARRKWGVMPVAGRLLTVIGVHTRRNGHNDGSLGATYAQNSICEDGTVHNCWNGGLMEDVTAWKAEGGGAAGSWTMFVHYMDTGGPGATCRRCRAIGSLATGGVGFYSHTAAGSNATMNYEDSFAYNVDAGFGGANSTTVNIVNSSTYRVGQAITAAGTTVNITGGIFNGDTTATPIMSRFYSPGSNPTTLNVSGVTVVARTTSAGMFYATPGTANITGNTFAFWDKNGAPWVVAYFGNTALTFQQNVVWDATKGFDLVGVSATVAASGNVYNPSGTDMNINGTTYPDIATYKAAVAPQDADASVADPVFVGSVQFGDVRVSAGSPARALGAGAQLNSSTVYTQAYWDALNYVTTTM